MRKTLLLTFITCFPCNFTAYAKTDSEIIESQKCSNIFSYFEKIYKIPQNTLYSISLQETQKAHSKHKIGITWPWTVTVNPGGIGHHFKSKREAIKFANAQLASGTESIDVGCMQINLKYHPYAFSSIEQAFTPRRNVAYGAKFLKEKYKKYRNWQQAIGAYHSSSLDKASEYHTNVKKISDSIEQYKQRLAQIANPKYNTTKLDSEKVSAQKQKSKFLGMGKVQVRVSTLKENNWFRKVK